MERTIIAAFMILMGAGIAGIWGSDLARGVLREGFFRAKDNGVLYWPHLFAEFVTAAALLLAGIAYIAGAAWASLVAYPALGALFYTSLNSLNWALAERGRFPYAVPMLVGLVGSLVSLVVLSV